MKAAPKTTDICLDERGIIVPLWVKKYAFAVQKIREGHGVTAGHLEILEKILAEGLPTFFQSEAGLRIKESTSDALLKATVKCIKGKSGPLNDFDVLLWGARFDIKATVASPRFDQLSSRNPGHLLQKLGRAMQTSKRTNSSADQAICVMWDGTVPKFRWMPPLCFTSDKVGAWFMSITEPNFVKHRQRLKLQRAPFKLLNDIEGIFGK